MLTCVLQLNTRRVKNDISNHLHITTSTLYQRDFLCIHLNDLSLITLRMSAGRLLHKVGAATAKEQPSSVVSVVIIARCYKDSTYSFECNE